MASDQEVTTMRIDRLTVDNFKSLVGLELTLAKFNCLIGLNGTGKSTVLQFIDFLSQQVRGDLKKWFDERNWRPRDINSRLTARKNVDFAVVLRANEGKRKIRWKASFNTSQLHCTTESIQTPEAWLRVQDGHYRIIKWSRGKATDQTVLNEKITFTYQGSILSQLRTESLPPSLVEFRRHFENVKALDLLAPEYLRQRAREALGSIGPSGKRLSAFLHELGPARRQQLTKQLKDVYPYLESLDTKSLRSGWKELKIRELYSGKSLLTEARHISDGVLRLIAILAELQTRDHRFLLFDEIENGINPELVEFVLDALVSAPQQVMVTTHSPLILNYLDDAVARDGVIYLYKNAAGHTQAIPFFAIPSLAEKLKFMGPGEAFVDTDLNALYEEIVRVPEAL